MMTVKMAGVDVKSENPSMNSEGVRELKHSLNSRKVSVFAWQPRHGSLSASFVCTTSMES